MNNLDMSPAPIEYKFIYFLPKRNNHENKNKRPQTFVVNYFDQQKNLLV